MNYDRAETPIEIGLTILSALIVLTFVEFIAGGITDSFIFAVSQINMDLSSFAQPIMANYINSLGRAIFIAPVIIAIVFIAWGFRVLYAKQQAIRTETGIVMEEDL